LVCLSLYTHCQPVLPENSWPDTWHSWVVTIVTPEGQNNSLVKGQLAVFDAKNQYTCRYSQQNLLNRTDERPTDMCDYKTGLHYRLNDTTLYSKCDLMVPLNPPGPLTRWSWPAGLRENAVFIGVDHIAQKDCSHFLALSLNSGGITVQMDVWVANDTGFPCQISVFEINAKPRTYITWAFDGFSDVIPIEHLRCSAPQVVCDRPDWTCSAKPGIDQDDLGAALQWVCAPENIDCDPLNPGGQFFQPNTVLDHCNWAFNLYFQKNKALQGEAACYFDGIAQMLPPKGGQKKSVHRDFAHDAPWGASMDSFLRENLSIIYPVDLVCN